MCADAAAQLKLLLLQQLLHALYGTLPLKEPLGLSTASGITTRR